MMYLMNFLAKFVFNDKLNAYQDHAQAGGFSPDVPWWHTWGVGALCALRCW